VPHQPLDGVDIHARFQQMRGEGMPQGVTTLPITRGSRGCVTSITRGTVKKWKSCARSGAGLIRV
jgi:hypothetical protein